MKLIWCTGFPEIYGQLEEGGMGSVCTGVVVFHKSIVDWWRGVGSICLGYMCILLYMKLIWCNGFPETYA